jgi:hypothetical protein
MHCTSVQGVLRSLVVLTNTSAYPVLYEWDLGVMGAPGSLSGGDLEISPGSGGWVARQAPSVLRIHHGSVVTHTHQHVAVPACVGSGRLQPGERVVARVSFTAGLVPALLEGEVTAR